MKFRESRVRSRLSVLASVSASGLVFLAGAGQAAEVAVVELTQVPCQFVESENGVDRGYRSTQKADCEVINKESGQQRVAGSEPLRLRPGKYVFRVTNKNVPYSLGFWLRGDGLVNRARLPNVSGGGLATGITRDYEIELEPGEYLYSCPLNTTPDYKLIVDES